jgi:hypothetical protein
MELGQKNRVSGHQHRTKSVTSERSSGKDARVPYYYRKLDQGNHAMRLSNPESDREAKVGRSQRVRVDGQPARTLFRCMSVRGNGYLGASVEAPGNEQGYTVGLKMR